MTDAQIDANGNYIGGTLSYQDVSSVTLAGGSAAIFLNPSGRRRWSRRRRPPRTR